MIFALRWAAEGARWTWIQYHGDAAMVVVAVMVEGWTWPLSRRTMDVLPRCVSGSQARAKSKALTLNESERPLYLLSAIDMYDKPQCGKELSTRKGACGVKRGRK